MSHTILAIDDTKKILDILRYFLEQEGYTVVTTQNPREGVDLALEHSPDLILLDIMMPGMDGYAVSDRLKEHASTKDIPVIMLTAKAVIMNTPKDFFYGLYGFLSKPFSRPQLLGMVGEVLKVTREERAKGEGKKD